jgi:hypothetical protein
LSRAFCASARSSPGISISWNLAPNESSANSIAFIFTRSTTPRRFSSSPSGIWIGTGFAPRRSRMLSTDFQKLAPARSILLMKHMRGTW